MDRLEPDGYLQPTRYRIKYRCTRCGHEYSRVTTKLDRKDPPCPVKKCQIDRAVEDRLDADERMAQMLEDRRAPGVIGSTGVKAIDTTAEIVMRDHHLTNLNESMRAGDIAAPKLPAPMQRAADGFFSGAEVARQFGGRRLQARVNQLGAQVLAGGIRSGFSPAKVQAFAGVEPGTPPLRLVRKEPAR